MKNIFKKRKSFLNLTMYYSKLFSIRTLRYKILRNQTCDIKFPIFLHKVVHFILRGIVVRKHKRNVNGSVTVSAYVSKNKLSITFPLNYGVIKLN